RWRQEWGSSSGGRLDSVPPRPCHLLLLVRPCPGHACEELFRRCLLLPRPAELAGNRQRMCSSPAESTGGASLSTSHRICLLLRTPGERGGNQLRRGISEAWYTPGYQGSKSATDDLSNPSTAVH
ncbi:unnamed protein product, partial [Urochloa humidicola]